MLKHLGVWGREPPEIRNDISRIMIGLIPISVIDMCMQCSYRIGYEGGEKIMSQPIFIGGGWGVMMEKQGRRSWRIDEDEGLDSPASRGS